MKLLTALALFTALSSVFGYTCYMCPSLFGRTSSCTNTVNCKKYISDLLNDLGTSNLTEVSDSLPGFTGTMDFTFLSYRCYSAEMYGMEMKGCTIKEGCVSPMRCCEGDLCNSAPHALPPVLLLAFTVFIALCLNLE